MGANRGANSTANRRTTGREREVSVSRDNLADPEMSLSSLASALVELAIQILGDEKSDREEVAA